MRIARVESRVLTYSPEHAEDSCSRRIEPRQRREAPRWRRGDGVLVATPASAKDRGGGSVHDGHVDAEVRGSSRGHGSGSQSPSARSSPGFRDRNLSPRYINSRSSLVVLKIVGSQLGYAARAWSRILVMGADDSTRGIAAKRWEELRKFRATPTKARYSQRGELGLHRRRRGWRWSRRLASRASRPSRIATGSSRRTIPTYLPRRFFSTGWGAFWMLRGCGSRTWKSNFPSSTISSTKSKGFGT
jgi:hypothetical protein